LKVATTWLIQTNFNSTEAYAIGEEVVRQGMVFRGVGYNPGNDICSRFLAPDENECTVCYGSIDFVLYIQRKSKLIPGAWCNFQNMKCSTYYTYFGDMLLNRYYNMMPMGELLSRWDREYPHGAFVRPDSGAKPLTGQTFESTEKHKIQSFSDTIGADTLVVVAPIKSISREYRFVVCDRKLVAVSMYLPEERSIKFDNLPLSLLRLANKICSNEWQPDFCYTVDIAIHYDLPYLLEINGFSCAGFYKCNIRDIVKNSSNVALMEWESYQ